MGGLRGFAIDVLAFTAACAAFVLAAGAFARLGFRDPSQEAKPENHAGPQDKAPSTDNDNVLPA